MLSSARPKPAQSDASAKSEASVTELSESGTTSGWRQRGQAWWHLLVPVILPLLVFWPRITGGGFSGDDWSNRAHMMDMSFAEVMQPFVDQPVSHRVLHLPYVWLYDNAFGSHQHLYLAWGVLSAGLFGALITLLLGKVGVPRWAATAIGALGAIYPYATMTKLWFTAHVGHVTGSLAVLGILFALHGLRSDRASRKIGWHLVALVCFLLSVEIYEIAMPVACAGGVFYLVDAQRRAGKDEALLARFRWPLTLWGLDLAVLGLWYLSLGKTDIPRAEAFSLQDRLWLIFVDGTRNIAGSFITFLSDRNVPGIGTIYSGAWFGDTRTVLVTTAVVLLALFCIALPVLLRRLGTPEVDPRARRIGAWGGGILVAIVAAYAGWIAIIPTTDYYRPVAYDAPAMRVNVIAAFGLAAIVVCVIGAVSELVGILLSRRSAAPVVVGVALLLISLMYSRHNRSEVTLWNTASDEQAAIMRTVGGIFGPQGPPSNSLTVLADSRGYVANGAEVFQTTWSFSGALAVLYRNPTLDGLAYRPEAQFQCGDSGVGLFGLGYAYGAPDAGPLPYGQTAIIVSLAQRKQWRLTDRRACRQAVREAGLVLLPADAPVPAYGTT